MTPAFCLDCLRLTRTHRIGYPVVLIERRELLSIMVCRMQHKYGIYQDIGACSLDRRDGYHVVVMTQCSYT